MSSKTGMQPIGVYTTSTRAAAIALLQGIIPDPDAVPGTGAVAGGGQGALNTYLDEMSPAAAAQLQVELAHILSDTAFTESHGQYVVTAGDVTATFAVLPAATGSSGAKGLSVPPVLANCAITVRRAGTLTAVPDAGYSVVGNTLHLASSGGYALTAGDVVTYYISA